MIDFACQVCQTRLSVAEALEGELARCPQCRAVVRVPKRERDRVSAGNMAAGGPMPKAALPPVGMGLNAFSHGPGRRFGFNCGYCSSRLEAAESMAAQEGQCPTCGNSITIPILDRYGRLIDPKTRRIIKADPHPVHAYAAAGERAPKILRQGSGEPTIQCPRCFNVSPITANNCKGCGMPFTMEGTTAEAAGDSNGYCVASLVLGVIGLPTMCFFVPSALAIVFGILGLIRLNRTGQSRGRNLAIAGIVCGAAGLMLFLSFFLRR